MEKTIRQIKNVAHSSKQNLKWKVFTSKNTYRIIAV